MTAGVIIVAAVAVLAAGGLAYIVARTVVASERAALDKTERQLRDTFQALAADALNANRSAFLDLARTSFAGFQKEAALDLDSRQKAIDRIVQPVLATLKEVDVKLEQAERTRVGTYAELTEKLRALGATTNMLSRALRTPAVRGRWGEMQLRRVVEIAGMLHRCDFDEQPGFESDNGRFRPDMIVHLPGGKQIVVDAKVGSSRVDLQACKLEYSIVSPK